MNQFQFQLPFFRFYIRYVDSEMYKAILFTNIWHIIIFDLLLHVLAIIKWQYTAVMVSLHKDAHMQGIH